MSVDEELARDDRDFIIKMMKLDPRDRRTAKDLLRVIGSILSNGTVRQADNCIVGLLGPGFMPDESATTDIYQIFIHPSLPPISSSMSSSPLTRIRKLLLIST